LGSEEGCLGFWAWTPDGDEFECEYEFAGDIGCADCIYGGAADPDDLELGFDPSIPYEEQREGQVV